ncbi:hypothetical protein TSUD_249210 [Trifolium subterraneum]|nr:hypothetical protein TSUD_249210 [Trifolium subterraneum]
MRNEISKINEMEKKMIDKLRKVVDTIHGKHEEDTVDECSRDQSVICTPLVTDTTPQSAAIDSSPNTSQPKRIRKTPVKLNDFVLYK